MVEHSTTGIANSVYFYCTMYRLAPHMSRAHARHRRLIAWWEGDTKREKEDERLKIASGTVLSNDRVRSRLLGKHKFDAKELFPN